jgi:long-chain acyl-CoA synthetase
MTNAPWLGSYPAGVPAQIEPDRYRSLVELLLEAFRLHASAPAFVNAGSSMSFADVDRASRDFAAYLQSVPGLERGDRIALMLPNLLQFPVAFCGVLRAGFIAVNLNPLYTPRELAIVLADSGAKLLIVLENFAHSAAAVPGLAIERVVVTRVGDHFPPGKRAVANFLVKRVKRLVPPWRFDRADVVDYRAALDGARDAPLVEPALEPGDVALLQYTGGTTGRPKGAMLTHRNMVSNVLQARAWFDPYFDARTGDVITALPLYHIFALTVNMLVFIVLGARNILITNPRDLRTLIADLKRSRFAFMTGVNTLFNALLRDPQFASVDFSSLRICLGGGMAVQRDVAERWQKLTGCVITQGYGLTETSPIVAANPLDATSFNGSVGLPMPATEVAIVDDVGAELGLGTSGEICVRGPQVMAGYWQCPEETEAAFLDGGWLKTGDIGHLDERGFLYIDDRKKDMIIVSGFNVYPNEVEDVVTSHPDVVEAAAIGISGPDAGETIKLFVVRRDPALSEEELLAYCRDRLTGYKMPHAVEFIGELPKSNVGKVLRRALRERVAASQRQ